MLSETFVASALDCWQFLDKTNKHKNILKGRIRFVMFCVNLASGETHVEFQHSTSFHFQVHNLSVS